MKKLFVVLTMLVAMSVNAQVTQQWVARYNGSGNGNDWAHSLAVDDSGNVYVTGNSEINESGFDYATIKYNSAGVQQWIARYNGPVNGNDYAYCLAIDGSGNVYVTGESNGSGSNYDYATIKYNSLGIQQWVARYDGYEDHARLIAVDESGNVYVTGSSWLPGLNNDDYVTIKYNSEGVQQWVQRYHNGVDYTTSLTVDNSGNVYVTGRSGGYGTGVDCATIKYNSLGVQQWVARYNGPGNIDDLAYSLAVDGTGNVYVTGSSYNFVSGTNADYITIKYNSSGVQQWVAIYNGPLNGGDIAYSIAVDSSGNVYVTGESYGGRSTIDYCTIKYNSAGVQQWVARYNGGSGSASSLIIDGLGNVYVTGNSWVSGTNFDYATIKYNNQGVEQWVQRYNGPGNSSDWGQSLKVDRFGNVYVIGTSSGNGTSFDYATIKYSQQVGIQNISTETPSKYSLSQNYPNPFNPSTNVKFSIVKSGRVKLIVYDIMGKEVQTLVNERLQPGTYEASFDGSALNSGVYFYKLITDDFTETKKMLMIK